jgi:hypothetical protein
MSGKMMIYLPVAILVATSGCIKENRVQINEAAPKMFAEPMPADILSRAGDCDWIEFWRLTRQGRGPGQALSCMFRYEPSHNSPMRCSGWDAATRLEYETDCVQESEFKALFEYMANNQSIFFDYSEFEGLAPGEYPVPPADYNEVIILRAPTRNIDPSTGEYMDYYVLKAIIPGETVSPEMQHVIDTLDSWQQVLLASTPQQG